MSLRSPRKHKNLGASPERTRVVIPAQAGIQHFYPAPDLDTGFRRYDGPRLFAIGPQPFSKERTKVTKKFGNSYISISYFVPFATFVVKFCSDFWLRLCCARPLR